MSARDASGSAPQHSHPNNNTMRRNEKFWVDQVTPPPPPPPRNDKGWGMTRGMGGGGSVFRRVGGIAPKDASTCNIVLESMGCADVKVRPVYHRPLDAVEMALDNKALNHQEHLPSLPRQSCQQ